VSITWATSSLIPLALPSGNMLICANILYLHRLTEITGNKNSRVQRFSAIIPVGIGHFNLKGLK
jgi:hypothetical protein